MNFVRIYLIVLRTLGDLEVSVHRDLESLENKWDQTTSADSNCAAMVHVGFSRPSNDEIYPLLAKYPSKVLITESARWALPEKYLCFSRPAGSCKQHHNSIEMPVYVGIDGWGYSSSEQELNKELAEEGVQKNPAIGWINKLSESNPALYIKLSEKGLSSDDTYLMIRNEFPKDIRDQLDDWRYQYLKEEINSSSLWDLLKISHARILSMELQELDLTVRLRNLFIRHEVDFVEDLQSYNYEMLMGLTNFGRKSYSNLVEIISAKLEEETHIVLNIINHDISLSEPEVDAEEKENEDVIETITLRNIVDKIIEEMGERDQKIIQGRFGYFGQRLTLEQIGEELNLTRERIRQKEKILISKLKKSNNLLNELYVKLQPFVENRDEPVIIELLETEDDWFKGFDGKYEFLAGLIENLTNGRAHVINVFDRNVLSKKSQIEWDNLVAEIRVILQDSDLVGLGVNDLDLLIESILRKNDVSQLKRLLLNVFEEKLVFAYSTEGKPEVFMGYGKSIENIVLSILSESESPLHKDELVNRISAKCSRSISAHHAVTSALSLGALLFDKSTFGLMRHFPLEQDEIASIISEIEDIIFSADDNRQWHSQELCDHIVEKNPEYSGVLNFYLLNIILDHSESLLSLGRSVWIKKNTRKEPRRIEISAALISILEDAGKPLNETLLKQKLSEKRGITANLQILSNEQMIPILPGLWGLVGRDIPISKQEYHSLLDGLHSILEGRKKALHITELKPNLENEGKSIPETLHPHTLFRLAQIDKRFRVGQGQLLGLSGWKDFDRICPSRAVKKIFEDAPRVSVHELMEKVRELTERDLSKQSVFSLLQRFGATFDKETDCWEYEEENL